MLELVKFPNDVLNKIMPKFDFDNPIVDPKLLEEQMVRLMFESNGIGLAAPQVGLETRVFTIMTRNIPEVREPFAVFNPEILAFSDELELGEEGCLSFPNLYFTVPRSAKIIVEFQDRENQTHRLELIGIDARCFQHELDHLNGICFTSKVSKLKLDRAQKKKKKLDNLRKRND